MVKINNLNDGKIEVITPYNGTFIKKARMLKGKWNGTGWEFKEEYEDIIKSHLMDIYGDDGSPMAKCKVRVNLTKLHDIDYSQMWDDEVRMFGRTLAIRKYRDSDPLLDKTVVLVKGGFSSRGGSRTNPSLDFYDDTILQIEDVPEHLYIKILKDYDLPEFNKVIYKIDKSIYKDDDIKALQEEKENLLKRLSEINEILEKYNI